MNTEPEAWKEIAFSYKSIEDFLRLVSLPQTEAMAAFGGRGSQLRCFGIGFYFFATGIRSELQPEFGDALHTLACRVEQVCMHSTLGSWSLNAEEARKLISKYFASAQPAVQADGRT